MLMRDIAFLPFLFIIFLFSANNAINSEEITVNNEQFKEDNRQLTENDNQDDVNHGKLQVNKSSREGAGDGNIGYVFSIGQQFGYIYAQAVEIVYPIETAGKYLSELLWDMKPLYYMGIQLELGLDDVIFSNLSFKTGFPGDSGIMEDRDWLSVENSDLTHYSKHTNRTNKLIMIDFKNGASFPLTYIYIKPFINFSWMHFSFAGRDGNARYSRGKKYDDDGNPIEDTSAYPSMFFPITDKPKEIPFNGEVITYEQNWLLLAPGFTLGTTILSPFTFDISFQISPLTYCAAVDNHLTTKAIYHDFTGFGLFLEGTGNVTFNWKFIELALEFTYRYISDTKGDTYQGSQSSDYVSLSTNKSGAGLSMMDLRLLFSLRF